MLVAQYGDKALPPNHPITRHVRRVVERILESSNLGTLASPESTQGRTHSSEQDGALWPAEQPSKLPPTVGGRQWNLMVVHDAKIVNAAATYGMWPAGACSICGAYCLSLGDIIVFTGILPVAKDEEGLAAVLGHGMSPHAFTVHFLLNACT